MREIKFRTWDQDSRKMMDWESLCCPSLSVGELFKGSGYALMQFAGLKDKNGKEIYEGDVISRSGMVGFITWDVGGAFIVKWINYKGQSGLWEFDDGKTEVIGNIHENPELVRQ